MKIIVRTAAAALALGLAGAATQAQACACSTRHHYRHVAYAQPRHGVRRVVSGPVYVRSYEAPYVYRTTWEPFDYDYGDYDYDYLSRPVVRYVDGPYWGYHRYWRD